MLSKCSLFRWSRHEKIEKHRAIALAAFGGCGGLGQLWEVLAELWEALEKLCEGLQELWKSSRRLLESFGASWVALETSWELLGRSWRRLRGVLEFPWAVLRALEATQEIWRPKGSQIGAPKGTQSSSGGDLS